MRWGLEVPSWVQGQSPVTGRGRSPPEAEEKCEIRVRFLTFSYRICIGFNEYRERAWTVYFANTQLKKF